MLAGGAAGCSIDSWVSSLSVWLSDRNFASISSGIESSVESSGLVSSNVGSITSGSSGS